MVTTNFRREPIRSRKYLDGSRGQPCTLQITGCCTGDTATTVAAHIRDETFGRSIKADDISIADACAACHDAFDGRTHAPLTKEEWLFYALRGLQRTLRNRVERGLVPTLAEINKAIPAPDVKPRKPLAKHPGIRKPSTLKGRGFGHQPSNAKQLHEEFE